MTELHLSENSEAPQKPRRPATLHDLEHHFERVEALDNEDAVVPMKALRYTPEGLLEVPDRGRFSLNPWSRSQLASVTGVKFDRWFENATPAERADDMNRRFQRGDVELRVRTRRVIDAPDPSAAPADGEVRALVSESYSPIKDSTLARMMIEALAPSDPELKLIRFGETEQTTSFVVQVGKEHRPDAVVGDLHGGVILMNSGVGAASLRIMAFLQRLVCSNGMCVPAIGGTLFRRTHRGITPDKLRSVLADRLAQLPGTLADGANALRAARGRVVENVEEALRSILNAAHLPLKLLLDILAAHAKEPGKDAFAVANALTRAAQGYAQELRVDLERAAGVYLQRFASSRPN